MNNKIYSPISSHEDFLAFLKRRNLLLISFLFYTSLVFSFSMLYFIPIDDWNTAQVVRCSVLNAYKRATFEFPPRAIGDIAHPLGLFIEKSIISAGIKFGATPGLTYFLFSSVVLAIAICSLFTVARSMGLSWAATLGVGLLYLGNGPNMRMIGSAQDNLTFHAPFLVSIFFFLRGVSKPSRKNFIIICIANLIVGLIHLQPFLILVVSQFAFLVVASLVDLMASRHDTVGNGIASLVDLLAKIGLTALLPLALLLAYLDLLGIPFVSYHKMWWSLFSCPSLREYFILLFGYIHKLVFPVGDGYGAFLSGLTITGALFIVCWFLSKQHLYLALLMVCAFGFPVAYQYSNMERWDTFAITLSLGAVLLRKEKAKIFGNVCIALMLIGSPYRAGTYIKHVREKLVVHREIRAFMDGKESIFVYCGTSYLDLCEDARELIHQCPNNIQLIPSQFIPSGQICIHSWKHGTGSFRLIPYSYDVVKTNEKLGLCRMKVDYPLTR